ncbi:DUF4184 family protein [Flavobacterium sp. K5-23]|uniref:DUF4184 family protein n=1 Tax=Flavobacterium sp. K5-23 TaxID=2746225 RepID=UPI00200EEE9E|nr:DUF4184 family protein [Flavobacterium sp. K5-23]UQD55833.1 DUF4184 family protein [Flavobacterium sp. K5-23]
MPFTFSHPSIILPLLRSNKLSATGLIVGSICPDFEYFIRMKVQSNISHTFVGLLLFNIPIGFLVALLFHEIIKKTLIENLPSFFRNRFEVLKNTKWIDYLKGNFYYVLISILIGAFSHIFWDAFTHESGYFVEKTPLLLNKVNNIPFYKIIQHSSSLIGMIFILHYVYKLPFKKSTTTKSYWKYWVLVLIFVFVFMSIRWAFGLSIKQVGNIVVSLISTIILAITFASLFFRDKKVI